jgi:ornithine cyclodeaminase
MAMVRASDMAGADRMSRVIDTLAEMFTDLAAGRTTSPARNIIEHEDGRQLLVGASVWNRRGVATAKISTITPDNPARGLPLIHGVVVLTDIATGEMRALFDGAELTAVRTGAVAALATRLWAPKDADELAVVGAGVQARALVRAISTTRPVRSVRVCSRTRARAEEFAEWIRRTEGCGVFVCDSAKEAVCDAPLICTATSTASTTPVLRGDWIARGAHLNVIGGTHEDAIEVEPSVFANAHVIVEERSAATREAGEVRAALAAGLIRIEDLRELGATPTPDGHTTVFRSVGLPIEDTAAAAALYQGAEG